ncbi:MAG: hypothetical protein ACI9EW_001478 [Cellvibrionaceae bacterium]|jgi:hypothetical protein
MKRPEFLEPPQKNVAAYLPAVDGRFEALGVIVDAFVIPAEFIVQGYNHDWFDTHFPFQF